MVLLDSPKKLTLFYASGNVAFSTGGQAKVIGDAATVTALQNDV